MVVCSAVTTIHQIFFWTVDHHPWHTPQKCSLKNWHNLRGNSSIKQWKVFIKSMVHDCNCKVAQLPETFERQFSILLHVEPSWMIRIAIQCVLSSAKYSETHAQYFDHMHAQHWHLCFFGLGVIFSSIQYTIFFIHQPAVYFYTYEVLSYFFKRLTN